MGKRSSVTTLPAEVKEWLDKALVEGNFSDYRALEKLLKEQGYDISKSSLHRYGSEFEARLAAIKVATDQAAAVAAAVPDDENALSEGLIRLVQQKAFDTLINMESVGKVSFAQLGKIAAELGEASVGQKKYKAEVKKKAKEVADAFAKTAKRAGLTAETVEEIKARILGIAG